MTGRELLIYLAIKFKGDYRSILNFIKERKNIDEEVLPPIKSKVLTMLDEDYPEEFKHYPYPPIVLFYYGDISLLSDFSKNVAVIGTRCPSIYGTIATRELVEKVSKYANVVSGLAYGVDALAHEACINSGGHTIAVLGSGIDVCYPEENKDLYDIIKQKHLIISEYPGLTDPSPDKFPLRNRLIAMISKAVVITEAHPRSGTSITASFALNYGKDVCCVPYRLYENSLCNQLIRDGAYLIESGDELLDIMKVSRDKPDLDL